MSKKTFSKAAAKSSAAKTRKPAAVSPSKKTAKAKGRRANVVRNTAETKIEGALWLDGGGETAVETGLPFFDHMLMQTAKHGGLSLRLRAEGDLHIDDHHTVEDCGIVVGQLMARALGDKVGVARFGWAYAPLDESLSRAVVDLSGRPSLSYHAALSREQAGGMRTETAREFFQAVANHAGLTLHLDLLRGVNTHHQIESLFKAFGLAFKMAAKITGDSLPSTKGVL